MDQQQIVLREKKTGRLHPCLLSALELALSTNNFEIADPEAYRAMMERRGGATRPGVIIRPEPVGSSSPAEHSSVAVKATADDYADDGPIPIRSIYAEDDGSVRVANEEDDEPRMIRLNI